MAYWLVDRMLPGVASGAVMAAAVAISHVLGRRDRRKVTHAQTEELKTLHAAERGTG